eukprot:CAMPEP_0115043906 /NCGR_PEP_ID=MMETSP0216-20121206/47155_1 /TAXON_ID=223996 /ORGANISM="Protocruzia adherens, Strain Boccale" /LENGTH=95 /DNA_ID=CAMNT_0002426331 /DNA_START=164 /DNA_END=447 /DNA_ORIENTATION=+
MDGLLTHLALVCEKSVSPEEANEIIRLVHKNRRDFDFSMFEGESIHSIMAEQQNKNPGKLYEAYRAELDNLFRPEEIPDLIPSPMNQKLIESSVT